MSGFWLSDEQQAIQDGMARLCARFDSDYWRRTDESGDFPEAFVEAMDGHSAKEERVLYPMCDRLLPDFDTEKLSAQLATG